MRDTNSFVRAIILGFIFGYITGFLYELYFVVENWI